MSKKYRVRVVASKNGSSSVNFESVTAASEYMAGEKAKQQFLVGRPNFSEHIISVSEIKEIK